MHILASELRQVLIDSGLIDGLQFDNAEKNAKRAGGEVLETLIGEGSISEENAREYLATFFGVEMIDLEKTDIDQGALMRVSESFAKTHGLILFAFNEKEKTAKIAMRDPGDLASIEFLRARFEVWIEVYMATSKGLRYGLNQYQKKIGEDFKKVIQENIHKTLSESGVSDVTKLAESIPTVTILDNIVEHAITLNTSDIHFEPFEDGFHVRFRIDGIMHEIVHMPKEIGPIVVARIKVIAGMQIDIHNSPQDGRFRFPLEDKYVDVRVSVLPTFYGEKGEMRLLQGSARPLSLTELGLSEHELGRISDLIKKPHGMILVTGPTGSGKTTTLYSVLHILNVPEVNINTIEDPIEYNIPGVNQTQVNIKAGVTFANGLRALVRQNPNIIMIGEIRDNETADIAVNASLTGHLVLSTLHTNDAPTAIPRLIDMKVQPFLIASTLDVVIAQRLVRTICSVCVQSFTPDESIKNQIAEQAKHIGLEKLPSPALLFKGKGCSLCNHTGYRGQIGIFEVLRISEKLRNCILAQAPTNDIKRTAMQEGMTVMFVDGLQKVAAGITTIEEVLRVTKE